MEVASYDLAASVGFTPHRIISEGRLDWELDEELRSHLELLVEEKLRKGMSLKEAEYAAKRSFGGAEQVKETSRAAFLQKRVRLRTRTPHAR